MLSPSSRKILKIILSAVTDPQPDHLTLDLPQQFVKDLLLQLESHSRTLVVNLNTVVVKFDVFEDHLVCAFVHFLTVEG
jgi:sulfur carrier protein ThiS